ncbi:MAG TPA: hypothetical protein VGO62_20335, partial [Myxococcota bacterium]
MSTRALVLVTFGAALFCSAEARAQDFVGTRALSLSEAYRATATGNDAIYFNPAGIDVIPRYAVELNYQLDLKAQEHTVDISVVDSKTSPMAAGISYTFDDQLAARQAIQHKATLALAYPVFDRLLSVGAGLKYVNVSDAILGNYLNALSADVGFLSRLPGGISVAGVGYNLIPIQSQRAPLSAGFGANLDLGPLSAVFFGGGPSLGPRQNAAGMPINSTLGDLVGPLSGLTIEGDWNIDFVTLYGPKSRISGGLEYLAFDSVPLRAGYLWDEATQDQKVSVGAGFIVPYFGLDVAYQQSVLHSD